MVCECSDGSRIYEQYHDPVIQWSEWGIPEGLSCFYICMTCNKSWRVDYYWGHDVVMSHREETK